MNPKEKIIDAATNLFSRKGFENASVRDIAKEAEVNIAMISYYFGSKEKLLKTVLENRFAYLRDLFTELVSNNTLSAMEKIDRITDLLIERKFSNRIFHKMLHRELSVDDRPQLKNAVSALLLKNITPVKKILEAGIASGEFRKVDVEMTVTTIIGTIHYLLTSDIMCKRILGKKGKFNPFENKELKQRVSAHTRQLMRAHLLKK